MLHIHNNTKTGLMLDEQLGTVTDETEAILSRSSATIVFPGYKFNEKIRAGQRPKEIGNTGVTVQYTSKTFEELGGKP